MPLEKGLYDSALDSSDPDKQFAAIFRISSSFRNSKDPAVVQFLLRIVGDEDTDPEIRWVAYVSALQVADAPVSTWPKQTPATGFRIPGDFDLNLLGPVNPIL